MNDEVESDIMDEKRVCIIGAGVSGLATAKVFLSRQHAVTVFERRGALGGVWAPESRYPGVRLQTRRQCYCFSDFPMPSHYPEFPSGQQVYEYLVSYAKNFGVDRTTAFQPRCRVFARAQTARRGGGSTFAISKPTAKLRKTSISSLFATEFFRSRAFRSLPVAMSSKRTADKCSTRPRSGISIRSRGGLS
jgi:phytoene dehydrogenase-like protein